ncbi:MAG TPA: glycoside hydrolase family 127 protein [Anaerohalosphaeraceae bacterium]|nr:glycoside hydrolase family 127 protein [Anaerohalosphaeraceae bacterium]HOL32184.1 glycoside hydrolase family 127 protein [Anaerohalosphaeraceae bacterium]HOM76047.1 glycoside hydrolase family 127 protein [Anaerohalosphaeraceae bacterium]HPC64203.1 glycoside hydrolase family 127 protein [Anaerohalosphaeraceae bacterium]HPO68829.1 glycoside hydrolase family 127 protein [Anaerohalosphaeraceae bacterium]
MLYKQLAYVISFLVAVGLLSAEEIHLLKPVPAGSVRIEDAFWSPKLNIWNSITLKNVLDKFEAAGAFRNFDRIAGKLEPKHEGPPWFDVLVYETIRGASDFLVAYPDKELEARIDGYIQRIAAAQAADPDGYVMTYTQLEEPDHRWGLNGGFLRWQHDVYNAGALVEAGIHYYRATGKIDLLRAAVKLANYMTQIIGPEPKKNIVPAHSLAEEAMMKLYVLFQESPSLKERLNVPVDEAAYLHLAEFWIEMRGRHCGQPASEMWDRNGRGCEEWIRQQKYGSGRPSWGEYAQDHKPVFQQETMEGHAVRATLLCTGLSAAAAVNGKTAYADAAVRLWENMVGKRMHITGGVGAFAHEEKFGPDYTLPNDAYLETCAAVGAGFFHFNMNLLFADARYIDQLERTLYNNVINGVSLDGTRYYYQNPLSANGHRRWQWHDCPCCPPMFLKFVSGLGGYIYAYDSQEIYVNLFIGSKAVIPLENQSVKIVQQTEYPWKGNVKIVLDTQAQTEFALFVRIPGWARGQENPFGLYTSDLASQFELRVNGQSISASEISRGYAVIKRAWNKGDEVILELPVQPRRIYAHPEVKACRGRLAIQSGPLVYCIEQQDNPAIDTISLKTGSPLVLEYNPDFLGGVNCIKAEAFSIGPNGQAQNVTLTAIPFYCQDNRGNTARMEVWLPDEKRKSVSN